MVLKGSEEGKGKDVKRKGKKKGLEGNGRREGKRGRTG